MSDSESSRLAFERALDIIARDYEQLPDAAELVDKITRKFTQLYHDPRVSELVRCKAVGDVNVDDARSLLFDPSVVQRRLYPIMLRQDSGLSTPLRLSILSLVYTLHRKKWPFLRDFVLADGLDALVEMLVEPNLYARGQVCEIMLSIIDSDQDRFDWFVPFNKEENCNGVRGHLYRKLAGVYTSSLLDKLIANSVNYVGEGAEEGKENSFPGGSARCLQIMAFWLSWMRVQFTPDQKLQLSGALLSHLSEWAEVAAREAQEAKDNAPAYKKPSEESSDTDVVEDEDQEDGEAKLARTLVEDFGAAGEATLNEVESNNGDFSDYFIALFTFPDSFLAISKHIDQDEHLALVEQDDLAQSVPTSATDGFYQDPPSSPAVPKVKSPAVSLSSISSQQLKDMGNEKFFANKFCYALGFYVIGIKKILEERNNPNSNTTSDNTTQTSSLLASLYYNCASCYWKLAAIDEAQHPKQLSQLRESDILKKYTSVEHLQAISDEARATCTSKDSLYTACKENCQKCLVVAPSHRRALHRQASCFLVQEQYSEALAVIETGLARIPVKTAISASSLSKQKKQEADVAVEETKALQDLRRLCMAHIMMTNTKSENPVHTTCTPSTDVLGDNNVGLILGKLRARHVREQQNIGHAWDGVERTGDELPVSGAIATLEDEQGEKIDSSTSELSSSVAASLLIDSGKTTPNTDAAATAKKSKKLDKEKSRKKAEEDIITFQKKCLKHNKALRKLVAEYITPDRRKLEVLDDGSEEYKEWMTSFNKALRSVWKAEYSLAQVFEVKDLDEDFLFALSVLLADKSGAAAASTKEKALSQIKGCAGFERVVNFLFMDKSVQLQGTVPWKELYLS